ncbi:MAG: FMN-binding protein [Cellulosilyticaceae bacterium]
MKKIITLLLTVALTGSLVFTGCGSDTANKDKVNNAQAGEVVELEGQQDQYGWFPHLRLTFDGDVLTEVYFDYVDDAGAKKSQDEEYNATVKEKTGISTKEAMDVLRQNLLDVQDPTKVDVVTGATQTSTEFITMTKQAYDQYFNGENSANNYGKGDPTTAKDDANTNKASDKNGTDNAAYNNGGDGTPNSPENVDNAAGGTEGGTGGAGAGSADPGAGGAAGQTNE